MTNRRRFLADCAAAAATVALVPLSAGAMGPEEVALDAIPLSAFAASQGSVFWLLTGGGSPVPLELTAVVTPSARSRPSVHGHGDAGNEKFTLMFQGSAEAAIEHGVHRMQQRRLGSFSLFLAPVFSRNSAEPCYEAVFNRPARAGAAVKRSLT